ncbi:MAG: hypothetical protein ACI8WB_003525 [Phenylobacterium sp.]|jgi:uncharacterized protein YacL (UPF0231 family)
MEFEFSKNTISGGYHAKFSLEHEVFAPWLMDEVGNDASQIKTLFQSIEQLRQHKSQELTVQGREYVLILNNSDVTLQLNASCDGAGGIQGADLEEELSVNDDNYYAACGLDDFNLMLESWQNFLNS